MPNRGRRDTLGGMDHTRLERLAPPVAGVFVSVLLSSVVAWAVGARAGAAAGGPAGVAGFREEQARQQAEAMAALGTAIDGARKAGEREERESRERLLANSARRAREAWAAKDTTGARTALLVLLKLRPLDNEEERIWSECQKAGVGDLYQKMREEAEQERAGGR